MNQLTPEERKSLDGSVDAMERNKSFGKFMLLGLAIIGLTISILAFSQANAEMDKSSSMVGNPATVRGQTQVSADKKYFGVVTEIDRGEGVFALEWDGYSHSASEWAGMIAEFKRRHSDLEVSSHSIMFSAHVSWGNGVVIITAPKNKCPR